MADWADIKDYIPNDACSYFRVKSEETLRAKSTASMLQTVACLERYLGKTGLAFEDIDENFVRDWTSWLLTEGYTIKTTSYYIKNFSALYGKAVTDGFAQSTGVFGRVRSELALLPEPIALQDDFLARLQKLVLSAGQESGASRPAVDILVFGILCGGLSTDEIGKFVKNGYSGSDVLLQSIVRRYSTPKNKYLFPLHQAERTPRQLKEYIRALFSTALSQAGIKLRELSDSTASDLWCMAALKCGISPRIVVACARHSLRLNPALSIIRPESIEDDERDRIIEQVASILTQNPVRWHAMQLRPSVTYDRILQRIENQNCKAVVDTYYPMKDIAMKVGHKVVFAKRPVISGLIYFRCHLSEVAAIFRSIGDLAWCYRNSSRVGYPYAVIPDREIMRLRLALADFDSDSEIFTVGSIPLRKNDKVEIVGGLFSGRGAVFDSMKSSVSDVGNQGKTICRLLLPDGNGLEWEVKVDSRMIRKISEVKFDQLTSQRCD